MSPSLRLAYVQGRPRFGRVAENLELGLSLAATVDADLVVIPELWSTGYVFSSHAEVAELAEDARTGATARALCAAAKREKRHYVPGFPQPPLAKRFHTALLVAPSAVTAADPTLPLF